MTRRTRNSADLSQRGRARPPAPIKGLRRPRPGSRAPERLGDAIAQYGEALRLKSDFPEAHLNLGNALLKTQGRLNDAIAQYETALRLDPDLAPAHYKLVLAYSRISGRGNDAWAHLETDLRLQPGNEDARKLMGTIQTPPQ